MKRIKSGRRLRMAGTILLSGSLLFSQLTGWSRVMEVSPAAAEPLAPGADWVNEGDNLDQTAEVHNINVWKVEDYELETMYDDPYVLRRKDNTQEAWVVFELPYVEEISVLGYAWPEHEGEFIFSLSADGENWEEAKTKVARTPDAEGGKWTQYLYTMQGLDRVRYVKIQWPETAAESNDWWNPYLGWIHAKIGQPVEDHITVSVPSQLEIPRYDSNAYTLDAYVTDQLGEKMEYPILWSAEQELPEGVSLSEEGTLTVTSACQDNAVIQLLAQAEVPEYTEAILGIDQVGQETVLIKKKVPTGNTVMMQAEAEVTLKAALLGDVNHDMKLDEQELAFVCQYYGADEAHGDWKQIRLADIDGNGEIDIIDMAYLAFHCGDTAEMPEEPEEGNPAPEEKPDAGGQLQPLPDGGIKVQLTDRNRS